MGYNDFRKVKVMMAMALEKRGWTILGWKDDESDLMTDYYSPANWNGIATKSGYILVVDDNSGYYSGKNITKLASDPANQEEVKKLTDKILKLRRMTMENNASKSEEETARRKIPFYERELKNLQKASGLVVVGTYPEYQPNPRGCKWHIEKEGVIYDKGTGISKFADIYRFDPDEPALKPDHSYYNTDDEWQAAVNRLEEKKQQDLKTLKSFQALIQRIDAGAGGTIGKGELDKYQVVTKVKKTAKNVAVDVPMGKLKSGQYFRLNQTFSNGSYKGRVYKITTIDDNTLMSVRMDKKLKKVLTGWSDAGNFFNTSVDRFTTWVERGLISMVKIQEVMEEEQYKSYVKV